MIDELSRKGTISSIEAKVHISTKKKVVVQITWANNNHHNKIKFIGCENILGVLKDCFNYKRPNNKGYII